MIDILELIQDYDFDHTPKYKINIFMSFIQIYIKEKNEGNRSNKISL